VNYETPVLLCIGNDELKSIADELTGVANLPAALAIKRRLVEQEIDRVPDLGIFDARAVLDDRQDNALAFIA
jgi:predicted methyltransferase